jgi:hypothetical protein
MRDLSPTTLAYLDSGNGICARYLLWFTARNRGTGAPEEMGLWTGDDNETFALDGGRFYHGAGQIVQIEPFTLREGLEVRMQTVRLAALSPEVAQLIRGYDPRGASCEIHMALFDPINNALSDTPWMVFDGWVETVSLPTPELGGQASCEVVLAASTRALTRTLPQSWSDATLRQRSGDRIARHADMSGSVETVWGELRDGQTRTSWPDKKRRKVGKK